MLYAHLKQKCDCFSCFKQDMILCMHLWQPQEVDWLIANFASPDNVNTSASTILVSAHSKSPLAFGPATSPLTQPSMCIFLNL
jgi:hypothetical protein